MAVGKNSIRISPVKPCVTGNAEDAEMALVTCGPLTRAGLNWAPGQIRPFVSRALQFCKSNNCKAIEDASKTTECDATATVIPPEFIARLVAPLGSTVPLNAVVVGLVLLVAKIRRKLSRCPAFAILPMPVAGCRRPWLTRWVTISIPSPMYWARWVS